MKPFVGMPVKYLNATHSYGEIISIHDDEFYVKWLDGDYRGRAPFRYDLNDWEKEILFHKELYWKQEIEKLLC